MLRRRVDAAARLQTSFNCGSASKDNTNPLSRKKLQQHWHRLKLINGNARMEEVQRQKQISTYVHTHITWFTAQVSGQSVRPSVRPSVRVECVWSDGRTSTHGGAATLRMAENVLTKIQKYIYLSFSFSLIRFCKAFHYHFSTSRILFSLIFRELCSSDAFHVSWFVDIDNNKHECAYNPQIYYVRTNNSTL